jgi:hypothetical protein
MINGVSRRVNQLMATRSNRGRQTSHHRVTSDLDAFEVTQSGTLCTADVGDLRAAGVEGAACGRAQRVGHFALHRGAGAAGVVHFGNRVQQETEHPQPLAASLRAMSNIPSATLSKRA